MPVGDRALGCKAQQHVGAFAMGVARCSGTARRGRRHHNRRIRESCIQAACITPLPCRVKVGGVGTALSAGGVRQAGAHTDWGPGEPTLACCVSLLCQIHMLSLSWISAGETCQSDRPHRPNNYFKALSNTSAASPPMPADKHSYASCAAPPLQPLNSYHPPFLVQTIAALIKYAGGQATAHAMRTSRDFKNANTPSSPPGISCRGRWEAPHLCRSTFRNFT